MASQLSNMMSEIESWESATEFGIPEDLWAGYQVRQRSDDLYIAVLSAVFDTLRNDDVDERQQSLSDRNYSAQFPKNLKKPRKFLTVFPSENDFSALSRLCPQSPHQAALKDLEPLKASPA